MTKTNGTNGTGQRKRTLNEVFHGISYKIASAMGNPWSFLIALMVIIGWGITGPIFHYSDTWQLVINTGTTIITFLAVFLLQNTQNRDARAMHLKLDELLRSGEKARNHLIDLEHMSDEELDELERQFKICQKKRGSVPEPPVVARGTTPERSKN
jgi:low affinity Fe/Cu permease